MARSGASALVLLVWAAAIAAAAAVIFARLQVSGDLRLFMPAPHTSAERLILQEVSEGPGSRLLMLVLSGAPPDSLAASSQALVAALRTDASFRLVSNGENRLDVVPDRLLPYRYLLSPTLDHQRLDANYLRSELTERQRDLASPAASLLEPIIPRDPTLEIVKLLQSWEPEHEPQTIDDVWFDASGKRALLVAETAAAAFDPQGQKQTVARLEAQFQRVRTSPAVQLTITGPGAFSVLMQGRSEADARLAGILDTAGMIGLMLLAYRRVRPMLLGALPLATAGVFGLGAVAALFGTVHGITIAFGFTLIGVALDYPIYFFSQQIPGVAPEATARSIWPTLAIAITGIAIAYLAFLASGVTGLAQLACFNVCGLIAAGLSTRYLLPRLAAPGRFDYAESRVATWVFASAARLPRPVWLAPVLGVLALAVLFLVPGPLWEDDLGHLTPVPPQLLAQYESLRDEMGSPDVRYLLAIDGADPQSVLAKEERLPAQLQPLIDSGAIAGPDYAARYLPTTLVQERRRASLPSDAELATAVNQATAGLAFQPGLFAPFLKDVAAARALPALTPAGLAGTPLDLAVGALLLTRDGRSTGLVTFAQVHDPAALERFAGSSGGVISLLDLKAAAETLVAHQRIRILWCVAGSVVLLAIVILLALRSASAARRVMTPMLLTALSTLAILHALGVVLNLFHLISLVLAAGLGIDYGLFLERSGVDPPARRRTLHAVIICAAAASVVFTVLATSALPVLRSIGVTVVMGVIGNFLLALILVTPRGEAAALARAP